MRNFANSLLIFQRFPLSDVVAGNIALHPRSIVLCIPPDALSADDAKTFSLAEV